jgi:DNA-binding transcriptional regulator YiaG
VRAAVKLARSRPEWAGRIEHLRYQLGLSQTALAQRLKVSAMAVSRWERGVNQPPAACYISLGKLAGRPECWYFWQRAGLSKQDLLNALPDAR